MIVILDNDNVQIGNKEILRVEISRIATVVIKLAPDGDTVRVKTEIEYVDTNTASTFSDADE